MNTNSEVHNVVLLPLKNDAWLQEHEVEYSETRFLDCVTLRSIDFDESGRITFWHGDGALFGGHDIEVRATEECGVTEAGLSG